MASCSGNGARGHHKFTLNLNETGTNIGNNTSTVAWSLVLSPIQSGWNWNISGVSYSVNVDGNVASGTIQSYNGSSTITIASGTKTITHNSNGSKSINFSFNVTDSAGKSYTCGNASGSGSLTLTNIPRYSVISSADNFNDEENPTIRFTNPSNGYFSLKAKIEAGGNTQLITRTLSNTATSCTFELTEAERNTLRALIPNSNSLNVRFTICSMSGNTELSSSYLDRVMTIVNANPFFSDFTYKDINTNIVNITGDDQLLIQGLSRLQVQISNSNKMEAIKQSTENKYTATIDTSTLSADYEAQEDIIMNIGAVNTMGTQRLTVRAYDSRNNSTVAYKDINICEYLVPKIYASATRLNNYEEPTTIVVNGSYSPVLINEEKKNQINNIRYRYRETDGRWGLWENMNYTLQADEKYVCDNIILNLDSTKSFEIEIQIIDNFKTSSTILYVDVGEPIFFISSNLETCYIGDHRILTEDDIPSIVEEVMKWL